MLEYQQLVKNPTEGIVAGPADDNDYFKWEAYVRGPPDTPFEGGVFKAELIFPPKYPISPPKMRFLSKIFHPNIYEDGRVCISILHEPTEDPTGYESVQERWSPILSVEKILVSVISMLAQPNVESPANVEAARCYRENREEFNRIAKSHVAQSLGM
ncbi:Ubiquitin-conjugating enzyme E2 G2 [Cichlidogyrus casuarinus]|uniref:Ubiquitin-conjugating enzyme E2 G2 n=1 Tax=Cichlidogyrus casuarinus TaxID=1844966 RepID=A0ABD2QGL9_9PLAT